MIGINAGSGLGLADKILGVRLTPRISSRFTASSSFWVRVEVVVLMAYRRYWFGVVVLMVYVALMVYWWRWS